MSATACVVSRCDEIRKSAMDRREYRHLKLANAMQVLLISDPDADKGAASMDVSVGFASDPPELPGLAHFTEHMLFLGTDKYPDEASYQARATHTQTPDEHLPGICD